MQYPYDTDIDIDVIFTKDVFAQETNNIHDEEIRKSLSNSYNDSTQGYSYQSNISLL
jgi:hypothetical protein